MPTLLLISGRAGCPLYSYSLEDSATPDFSLFPVPYSLFPIPDSPLPTPHSLKYSP
ncbi:MAG: hypothetical protein F6J90_22305 [Moorea sp. SIOASIH]|uniref:hypothetical protein n=1 Tax=Moorena sp. SIOASIH TaxID=2607817 RepID=UPI0013BD3938|nr:hypothetical protein [Moorena sp. SIOASIH]NEO38923.1 hypothetical protein [Moorena sp. SIOASIH]